MLFCYFGLINYVYNQDAYKICTSRIYSRELTVYLYFLFWIALIAYRTQSSKIFELGWDI